jgi:hypothetical protein
VSDGLANHGQNRESPAILAADSPRGNRQSPGV